jgi:Fur family ferric uptake transcriptional regulator
VLHHDCATLSDVDKQSSSKSAATLTANQAADVLTQQGYRLTTPRRQVLQSVLRHQRPFTAEQLVVELKELSPGLGRATVYRTLEILASVDVLTRILQPDGHPAYVVGVPGHRHHLVCSGCGTTVAFTACPVDDLMTTLSRDTDFSIQSHFLEVFGVCPTCQDIPAKIASIQS